MIRMAIIGASYLQVPLIKKARELGIETHVFASEEGAMGKDICEHFYPISITAKEQILEECKAIRIHGITSIGSDLAMPTVNYVANEMNITGNSVECTFVTTNKYAMRQKLSEHNLPCPRFNKINSFDLQVIDDFTFPLIIKPTDRSGSRGVAKIKTGEQIEAALVRALSESFVNEAIIEEFIEGKEISVEMVSWKGTHHYITCTDKVCTGEPYFVEIEQHVPAHMTADLENRIIALVKEALTVLGVEYGASHSEILITNDEQIFIVEIGARMGGDNIGSDLVELFSGYDFVKGVIEIALGEFTLPHLKKLNHAGIYYLTPKAGRVTEIRNNSSDYQVIVSSDVLVEVDDIIEFPVTNSSQRSGYIIYAGDKLVSIDPEEAINIITEQYPES
jgi:biotin carboxylase